MFEQLEKNLFVFYSSNIGSNVYVLIGKTITLIDTSLKANSSELIDALHSIGIKESDIELVLFTHAHADHIGCASFFPKAEKRMHESDAKKVELRDARYTCSNILNQDEYPRIDSYLKKDEIIEIKPFSLQVIHTPGHTQGSVCFYDESKRLLFSGDTLFENACGRTDLPGSSEQQLVESLFNLQYLKFDVLLPGHGVVFKGNQQQNIEAVLKTLQGKYY